MARVTVVGLVLRVFNTRSRDKEDFVPLEDGSVRMYVCGPTVYDDCHVGHARSYVAFDVVRRYLEYKGNTVTYVQNFTDVDDKIINRAREKGTMPLALSEHFIQEYYKDMDRLNIRRATIHPKASELVPDMVHFIDGLIKNGHAYVSNGSVYFEVETAKEIFGQLRHQNLSDMKDGARVEVDPEKRSPKDFALWKKAKEGEISWDSPWGKGRPGWHIECSTMSQKYLGDTLDIHGGGMDLIFPHHESEILQSESRTGRPFVRYWMHNGFVEIDHEKMSKSLGNFFTVKDILKRFDPMVLRFFLVYTHYRSPIDFSDAALHEAKSSFERLRSLHAGLSAVVGPVEPGVIPDYGATGEEEVRAAFGIKKGFLDAMDDDFNTRVAVSQLFKLDETVRSTRNTGRLGKAEAYLFLSVLDELSSLVGLEYPLERPREAGSELAGSLIALLIDLRAEARKRKDFDSADTIRNRLKAIGVVLEDEGGRTLWKLERPA